MSSRSQPGSSRAQTHYPGSSNRYIANSPALPRGTAARQILSTPRPQRRGYSASPGAYTSSIFGRAESSGIPRLGVYSPQLPPHPQRQRLSLRPSSLGRSTTPAAQSPLDEDDHDDLAGDPPQADALNEVVMAIDMNKAGSLGCAYYIAAEEKLLLLDDVAMAGVEIVETLLLHAKPTTILTPSRTAQVLLDLLNNNNGAGPEDQDVFHRKQVLPNSYPFS